VPSGRVGVNAVEGADGAISSLHWWRDGEVNVVHLGRSVEVDANELRWLAARSRVGRGTGYAGEAEEEDVGGA
jgi:hypothetical protein